MNNLINNLRNNSNVPSRCINTAEVSKGILYRICGQYGLSVRESCDDVDIYRHIDYFITFPNKVLFTIDIKSSINLLKEGCDIDNTWVWVEFKNVQGRVGWLYGNAEYLGYILLDQIWFIQRRKLITFIEGRMPKEVKFVNKDMARYRYYQRLGRLDILTLANLKDIKEYTNPVILVDKG